MRDDRPDGRVVMLEPLGRSAGGLSDLLRDVGLTMDVVSTGDALFRALEERLPILVIVDARVPGVDVPGLVERTRQRWSRDELPILGTSVDPIGLAELTHLRRKGCDGFLSQSVPDEHALYKVRSVTCPPPSDVRGNPRVAVSLPVRLRCAGVSSRARSLTLSRGGLFVRTDTPPWPDADVWVSFGLPNDPKLIEAHGRVVHVQRASDDPWSATGFGLRFDELPEADADRIGRFVESWEG